MTKKEFITNFLRDLGFEIKNYGTNAVYHVPVLSIMYDRVGPDTVTVFSDRHSNNHKNVSVKFKWNNLVDDYSSEEFAINLVRKANAWLAQRGFEAVADWCNYRRSYVRPTIPGVGYLRIRSKGYPWQQCAKNMTNEEVYKDALFTQERHKTVGYLQEDDYEDQIQISQKITAICR